MSSFDWLSFSMKATTLPTGEGDQALASAQVRVVNRKAHFGPGRGGDECLLYQGADGIRYASEWPKLFHEVHLEHLAGGTELLALPATHFFNGET